jgi:hypothetical protein
MHVNPGQPAVTSAHTPVSTSGADTAPPRHLLTHRVTARRKLTDIDNHVKASGRGADKTTMAQGLQDYAVRQLPFLKGAVQEARRINHYREKC